MHHASLASPRLQRVARVLSDGRQHSTLDLIRRARVCAVNSCIAELRENGVDIECKRKGDVWSYRIRSGQRWRCLLCGRDKFDRPGVPHNCVGGFRKRFAAAETAAGKPNSFLPVLADARFDTIRPTF